MATRRNLCLNPAVGVAVTGWGGGSTPTRVDVTGAGFGRDSAAEYTAGTFASTASTATGAVTAGQTYTCSVYLRTGSFAVASGTIYIEWINGSGGGFGYPSAGYSLSAATIGRASVTAVAPSGAVAARIVVDGTNFSINSMRATTALIEESGTLGSYFDGTFPAASWDGAAELSSSTLSDAVPVSGTITSTLPALTAGLAGAAIASGQLAGVLPALDVDAVGAVVVVGAAAMTLPALGASFSGAAVVAGAAAVVLPPLAAGLTGAVAPSAMLAARLPALTAHLVGESDAVELGPAHLTSGSGAPLSLRSTGSSPMVSLRGGAT
ncbi:hypothetical protein ACQPYK_08585 [Streptosporangium sp. CA-135522]|uniref:hypothetical protein n=1 Tax=Streptosporangium sp. CA-135522 TaxID=3240072 RepID=UPI003D89DFB0